MTGAVRSPGCCRLLEQRRDHRSTGHHRRWWTHRKGQPQESHHQASQQRRHRGGHPHQRQAHPEWQRPDHAAGAQRHRGSGGVVALSRIRESLLASRLARPLLSTVGLTCFAVIAVWVVFRPPFFDPEISFVSQAPDYVPQVESLLAGEGFGSFRYPPVFPLILAGVSWASTVAGLDDAWLGGVLLLSVCLSQARSSSTCWARDCGGHEAPSCVLEPGCCIPCSGDFGGSPCRRLLSRCFYSWRFSWFCELRDRGSHEPRESLWLPEVLGLGCWSGQPG